MTPSQKQFLASVKARRAAAEYWAKMASGANKILPSLDDLGTFIDIVEGMEREIERLQAAQQASADLIASLQSDVDKGHGWYRECAALTVEVESLRSQLTQQAAEIASLKHPE